MHKLTLKVQDIQVTGFEMLPEVVGVGTVQGADALTRQTFCNQETCWDTCDAATCLC